jgi:hypothetical protein
MGCFASFRSAFLFPLFLTGLFSAAISTPLPGWYWPLNETNGTRITDLIHGDTGTAVGVPQMGGSGLNAVELTHSAWFDGVDDGFSIPGLPALPSFTISFWMKPEAARGVPVARSVYNKAWTLQLLSGSDSTRAQLCCWINDYTKQTRFFDETVYLNRWTHVALSIDAAADSIRIYLNGFLVRSRAGLSNYSDDGSCALTFAKRTDNETFFKGSLAGVALYKRALTSADVQALYLTQGPNGGNAQDPRPANHGFMLPYHNQLQWDHNFHAIGHRVFVGPDSSVVRTADTTSTVFKGTQKQRYYQGSFNDRTTYYWRVDEVYPDTVIKGDVHCFTKCDPAALFHQWGVAALDRMDATFRKSNGLYAGGVKGTIQDDYAFVWGQTVAWFGLNAAAAADQAVRSRVTGTFWPAFYGRYRNNSYNLWAYNAYMGSAGTDRYFDDNGHIIVALMELYDQTGNQAYLDEAKVLMSFEMAYENNGNGLTGMPWHETYGERNRYCNGVASTLVCQAALMVYRASHVQAYLDFAKRIYDGLPAIGMIKHTETGEGIVFEGCEYNGTTGKLDFNYGYLAYVTDYFTEADLLLYEITGDRSYLEAARRRALSIEYQKLNSHTGGMIDPSQWGGYSHVRALVNLCRVDSDLRWRTDIFSMLKRLHDVHNIPGAIDRYSTRWDSFPDQLDTLDILGPAGAITGYLWAASPDLWTDDGILESIPNEQTSIANAAAALNPPAQLTLRQTGKTILLTRPAARIVSLRVLNLAGRTVAQSTQKAGPAGTYRLTLPQPLANGGCYVVEVRVDGRCTRLLTLRL